jgi:hypothetical protein
MDDDAIYRPVSPNLDSISRRNPPADNEPLHPQHQRYRGSISHQLDYPPPAYQHKPIPPPTYMPPRGLKKEEVAHDEDYNPDASLKPEKSKGKARKEGNGTGGAGGSTALPGTENINITVHFPVARIKRIMQADDDVGKVAQVTPVVVCKSCNEYFQSLQRLTPTTAKALELFMISLVTKAAAEAKARNSKRVGAGHLKQAITKIEQFDFLSDIMAKVADAPVAADKHDGDPMDVDGKKKKAPGRRKKKAEEEEF